MDIKNIAASSSILAQQQTQSTAGMLMAKKSMDIQKEAATQLLEAIPQNRNPENLGQRIDVKV